MTLRRRDAALASANRLVATAALLAAIGCAGSDSTLAPPPSGPEPVATVTVTPNLLASAELFDPAANTFTPVADLPYAGSEQAAVFVRLKD